jgi:hypothetical protein
LTQILPQRRQFLIATAAAAALLVVAADGERRVLVKLEPGVLRSFDDAIVEYEMVSYEVPLRQALPNRFTWAANHVLELKTTT